MDLLRYNVVFFLFGTVLVLFARETSQTIPPEMWLHMRNVTNPKDFIINFLKKKPSELVPGQPGQPGHPVGPGQDGQPVPGENVIFTEEGSLIPGGTDQMASMLAVEEDRCEVKTVSVPVPADIDPNVIFWPSCVKLERCSGCCHNEMLKCVPSQAQTVETTVLRARYPYSGADYFNFEGIHPVLFERHLQCECRCRVQMEDCNLSLQLYDEHSCACKCFNENEASTCVHPKIWNNTLCRCVCPSYGRECYDDERYDDLTCSCAKLAQSAPQPVIDQDQVDACEHVTLRCRYGYEKRFSNGECRCVLARMNQMEGSIMVGHNSNFPTDRPPQPQPAGEPVDFDRVPGHPQLIPVRPTDAPTVAPTDAPTAAPTRRPKPTRRPRRPRRPRGPRRGSVIRH